MYVYVNMCMYVCMYIIRVCMIYTYIYIYIIRVCIYNIICMYVCVHICICMVMESRRLSHKATDDLNAARSVTAELPGLEVCMYM
jgi:hypothetical protein